MNQMQILDVVNIGIAIIDKQYTVREWNHWLAMHSGISQEEIVGKSVFRFFPDLNNQSFIRGVKSVITFGNTIYFSQRLHKYLFPCKLSGAYASVFEYMQQQCTLAPVYNEETGANEVLITVIDVTESLYLEKSLREINLMDALTRVYNRRYLDQRLKEEILRYNRYQRPLSLIMLDLDHFKGVNDTFGHSCGDMILEKVSAMVTILIRGSDLIARYGGEEFCCVLPDTDLDGALLVAERIRANVEAMHLNCDERPIKVTVSLGIAEASPATNKPADLLKAADKAMYKAKRAGRNRVAS